MARRPLSDEEKKLWQKVTRDVSPYRGGRMDLDYNSDVTDMPGVTPDIPKAARNGSVRAVSRTRSASHEPRPPVGRDHAPSLSVDHNWQQKLRRGKVALEGKIDLHGMTQDRAFHALSSYIHRARSSGKRVILVVTGKGGPKRDLSTLSYREFENRRGVLRDQVPGWLSSGALRSSVVSFFTANREHGGEGALYLILRKADR